MHTEIKRDYYSKERNRLLQEIAAYTDASRNQNRFTEYYKLRISYLERLLTECVSQGVRNYSKKLEQDNE